MSSTILELRGVHAAYGAIQALRGIDIEVRRGEIVALIGANGAGKTTTLMTISQVVRPTRGEVLFEGEPLTGIPPHEIVRRGVCQVPEGRHIFPRLTILENLEMGAFLVHDRAVVKQRMGRMFEMFPILAERRSQYGGTLSGGEQQMLAIARALMGEPRILLLDEPSLGLAPLITRQIFEVVRELRDGGTTVLVVEQNANLALRAADRGYVLETGAIILSGTGAELLADPRVREAYLGE